MEYLESPAIPTDKNSIDIHCVQSTLINWRTSIEQLSKKKYDDKTAYFFDIGQLNAFDFAINLIQIALKNTEINKK